MDSIYFNDPLGLLIELASYRFEPPRGHTHADVLLEAHLIRVERGDYNIAEEHLADAIEALVDAIARVPVRGPLPKNPYLEEVQMAANTLSILRPSVNNLTARIFVRAAGLDFEEIDVWGKKGTAEFLAKDPADLTPLLECDGLPTGPLWESCAIMQYLCNKHGLDHLLPDRSGERAMVDSAMFYLIGTLYPLVARATYPTLSFPQYPGEVGSSDADDEAKARAQVAARRHGGAARGLSVFFLGGRRSSAATRRRSPTSGSPPRSSSSARSTTSSRRGSRTTSRRWSRRSATRTPSLLRTCAGTSRA